MAIPRLLPLASCRAVRLDRIPKQDILSIPLGGAEDAVRRPDQVSRAQLEESFARRRGHPVLPLRSEPKLVWTEPTLEEIEYTEELRKLYRCEVVGEAA
jgi:hypothetical protein